MISMRFEGGDDLAKAFGQLSTRLSRQIVRDGLLTVGEPIRKGIQVKAPREPGQPDLADNVQMAPTRVGEPGDVSVGIGVPKSFFYDWFLEFGTSKMGAQPFYRPTFDTEAGKSLRRLGDLWWTELAGKGIHRSTSIAAEPVSHVGPFL